LFEPTTHGVVGGGGGGELVVVEDGGVVVTSGGGSGGHADSVAGSAGVVTGDGEGGLDSVTGGVGVAGVVAVPVGGEGSELDVIVGAAVIGGGVVVVADRVGSGLDCAEVGGATSGAGCATVAASAVPSVTIGRPPLPLVPGGTGPGADGVGTTPVRYACAHPSTMFT
jgi:hypothetical protein